MHVGSEFPILYFGTAVVLVSTSNEDGSANLAPMSSAWWLGWRCVLGLAATSLTTQNLLRTPSPERALAVQAIIGFTGHRTSPTSSDATPFTLGVRGRDEGWPSGCGPCGVMYRIDRHS